MKPFLPIILTLPLTVSAATFEWTGASDGSSVYLESNWQLSSGTGTLTINPNTDINHDLVVNSGTPGGSGGASNALQLGSSGTLTINNGTFRMAVSSGAGIRNGVITVNGGTLITQFFANSAQIVLGNGTIELHGAGNPVNASGINILAGASGSLHFRSESPANVRSEHLAKITVAGAAAVENTNIFLTDDGSGGTIVTGVLDSDNDGMTDSWEIEHFGDLSHDGTDDSSDNDGLTDKQEFDAGTDPTDADTDNDTIEDGDEVNAGTDPTKGDSDGDGLADNVETNTGTYVSPTDTGTDPLDANTDNDRGADGVEVARGFDPTDPNSHPNLPNIILILADDLGYGELGSYGQTKILTPRLDTMASQGMRFTNFYCGSAVCAPTRAMLLTGKHAGQCYIRNNGEVGNGYQTPLPENTETIATMLKQAGYVTSCIGKWGLGGPGSTGEPKNQGFDHFFGYLGQVQAHHYYPAYQWRNQQRAYYSATLAATNGTNVDVPGASNDTGFDNLSLSLANKNNNGNVHSHDASTKEALDWITANKDTPFFMYLAYPIPHISVQAPGHIDDITDADGIVFTNDRGGNTGRTCMDEFYPVNSGTGQRPFGAPIAHGGSGHYTATADKRHEYAAMISAMDRDIGRIEDLLATHGLTNDTIIIFTSDNGATFLGEVDQAYFNSNGGLRGAKGNLYEGGIREPFIIKWPGKVPAGTVSNLIAHQDDLMSTFAEITGTVHAADTTGRSILPTFLDPNTNQQQARDHLYWEFSSDGGWSRAVRQGDWKLLRVIHKTTGAIVREELYNLSIDPSETNDVSGANPAIVADLKRIMQGAHSVSVESKFFRPTDEFATQSGVTLSHHALGMQIAGTGHVFASSLQDITQKVTFKLSIDPTTAGANTNGAFLFGTGDNVANFIKVEINENTGNYIITHGSDTTSTAITGGPHNQYDIEVQWDPTTSKVKLTHGADTLELTLTSPPAKIDRIGYSVNNATTNFKPAIICLATPDINSNALFQRALNGNYVLSYSKPLSATGIYEYEQSTDLSQLGWTATIPLRIQPRTGFGGVQMVDVELVDPTSAVQPRVFYRVKYTP